MGKIGELGDVTRMDLNLELVLGYSICQVFNTYMDMNIVELYGYLMVFIETSLMSSSV